MDTKKDMVERDERIVSGTSDTNQANTTFSEKGEHALSGMKRTERLSAALYMVTGLIPDTEPLKWRLRERSLSLLGDMSVIRETSVPDRALIMDRASDTVVEIVTLLNVALAGDLVSEMNVAILKKEYVALREHLEKGSKVASSTERFVRDLFKDERHSVGTHLEYGESRRREEEKVGAIKGHIKDIRYTMSDIKTDERNDVLDREERPIMSLRSSEHQRDNVVPFGMHGNATGNSMNKTIADIKEERRQEILVVVKKKKNVTIKDITFVVRNVGEKTIQRELAGMVEDGVLKKEGAKRWSTYSLV